jgi:hypothetical protein
VNRRHLSVAVFVAVFGVALALVAGTPPGTNPVQVQTDAPEVTVPTPITGTAMTTGEPPVTVRLYVDGEPVREDTQQESEDGSINCFRFPTLPFMAGRKVVIVATDAAGNSASVQVTVSR